VIVMGFRINLLGGNYSSGETSLILVSLFLVGGITLMGYGFTQYRDQSQNLNNAVNVSATVTDTNIRTDSSRRGGTDYQAEISFEYSYEEQSYSSDFIYPLDDDKEFNQQSKAHQYIDSYPTGSNVEAFVNSESPETAFLNAERSNQPLILMIVGTLTALMGAYKLTRRVM